MTDKDRQAIIFVAHARSLVGARWRHRGRKPWALDCVGMVYLAGRAAGFDWQDKKYYGREPLEDKLRGELEAQCGDALEEGEPWKAADVVLINWERPHPTHVGILADSINGGLSLIHCENINGCVEQDLNEYLIKCIVEVYRPCAKSSQ